ncbi:hypothetical protein MtrunA17_Chr5g0416031 [Medicago truncatula]|uniref:Uncharacterized protein n=1 Tax=Medicago truncatula TaxID=3880 RepID=A0A396HV73_MEDTR|nr:hypothetical protein MtrunA17_Chr5g0416031 [Medicago truncatula]
MSFLENGLSFNSGPPCLKNAPFRYTSLIDLHCQDFHTDSSTYSLFVIFINTQTINYVSRDCIWVRSISFVVFHCSS